MWFFFNFLITAIHYLYKDLAYCGMLYNILSLKFNVSVLHRVHEYQCDSLFEKKSGKVGCRWQDLFLGGRSWETPY